MERLEIDGALAGLQLNRVEVAFAIKAVRHTLDQMTRLNDFIDQDAYDKAHALSEVQIALRNSRGQNMYIYGTAAPVLHNAISDLVETGEPAPFSIASPTIKNLLPVELKAQKLINPGSTIDLQANTA